MYDGTEFMVGTSGKGGRADIVKVLHVMPSLSRSFGGPTQSLVGYALAGVAAGYQVEIAGPKVTKEDSEWLRDEMPGVICHFFATIGSGSTTMAPALMEWLKRYGNCYDTVHVHGLFNPISSLALRLCIKRKWPVVIRPFGTLSRYTFTHRRSWLKQKYFRFIDRPSLECVAAIHFTTEAECEEAGWHGIDLASRSHVVPPPLPAGNESSVANKEGDGMQVLFLSRLHRKKNIEALLNAWPQVLRELPGARLTIAGTGEAEYVRSLKRLSYQLGCGQIKFTGFVEGEAKEALLNDSDVFVLPSFQENFGVAVLEALAAGLPVVITPEVQLADFVIAHNVGCVIEPTPEKIASNISTLLQNKSFRTHCAHAGPALVQKHFSIESVGYLLAEMYESVIEKNNAVIY